MHIPVIWVDHHPIVKVKGVNYFNPRFKDKDDNRPTSYWCYKIVKGEKWIALLGIVSDWNLASFNTLKKGYEDLFKGVKIKNPDDVMFDTEFGKLIKIVSFNLKGLTRDTYNFIDLMLKIKDPYEILNKETEIGKEIYNKYEKINKEYIKLYNEAIKLKDDEIIVFRYVNDKISFTSYLSNELLHRTKAKLIIVGRIDKDEVKGSIRNREGGVVLPKVIKKALQGLNGYGGGHDRAVGFCVKLDDFDKFIEKFKKLI